MIAALRCLPGTARDLLAGIEAKADAGGRFSLDELIDQGEPFAVMHEGRAVAAYVLKPVGPLLWISAAAGRASFDLVSGIDALVTAQGREFDQVGFRTERRGLVRKAELIGYQVTHREGAAYFLRKNIAR